jgi:signal transduction histidine kinase
MRTGPPLSLGVKLGLVLFLLVAGAMGIVYFAVVPRLESKLVDSTLSELRQASRLQVDIFASAEPVDYQRFARILDSQVNARVALLVELQGSTLTPYADSRAPLTSSDLLGNATAAEAYRTGEVTEGRTQRDGRDFAELARPIGENAVLLLSAPLADRLAAVNVVRRDVLVYGGLALAAAWLAGALLSLKLSHRIRRLEAAADRIAGGDFDAPVVDSGQDELAELARSFERMRVRLSQLDGARREFIANASHELRTPLFALGGFLELLVDEELDEATRRDFLETARGQVDRLTRLATDLLDLSRLDAEALGLASEPVDLAEAAAALAEEFGPLAEANEHLLTVSAAGDVVALADGERVLRIGRSLVENALRHTPAGTTVELRAAIWVDKAQLSVHDDGPGIPPDEQERVFDRFYRGERNAAEGSGIGLAIARELAMRMDGTIELRSEPGATTFTLVLRRAHATAPFPRENALV